MLSTLATSSLLMISVIVLVLRFRGLLIADRSKPVGCPSHEQHGTIGSGECRMSLSLKRLLIATLLAVPFVLPIDAALALDQVRLGKAVPNSFAFGAAEVGIEAKIYEQEGIDLQVLSFAGDARIQQALTADSIDVAVGSGPGLGFRAKGVPAIGVAAMYGPPSNLSLTVGANSS